MMPSLLQCPDCSAALSFISEQTNLKVCSTCGTVVYRSGEGTAQRKALFVVSHKTEIIQPGTTGQWKGQVFQVLGRFRTWFEESVFNYWTIRFDNGNQAWLAEAYGLYAILKPIETTQQVSSAAIDGMETGNFRKLFLPQKLLLNKKQKTIKWEIEGELYIPAIASSFRVLDFSADDGKNMTLFDMGDDRVFAFDVAPASFAALQLTSLQEYQPSDKQFICAHCRKTAHVKTYPYAQSYACISCGTYYSLQYGTDFKKDGSNTTDEALYLPIGSTGEVMGTRYEIVGYTQKEEQNSYHSNWREYTLFNPREGFAFLSEYDGHWIYIRESNNAPVLANSNEQSFELDNEPFQLYNAYHHSVVNARGEFPYNIFDNAKTKIREYISPPEVWIQEKDRQEGITWFLGKHVAAGAIQTAFNVGNMPAQYGIGAVQPTGYLNKTQLIVSALIAVLIILLLHTLIGFTRQERVLLDTTYPFTDSSDQVSNVTEKFTLDKRRSNLRFTIMAPVNDSWFELGITLVNTQTGKEYSLEQGVEYYSGYSDGEYWSEGGTSKDVYLTRIPGGTYFLQLQGTRESQLNKIPHFWLLVTYDVPSNRNLWFSIVLLLLWPVGKFILVTYNEKRRWSNSPYSPFES